MKMMMIVLLLLISQHASGVEVYKGAESVLLPCQVSADVSRSSTAAVWNRDGFSNPTVHLRLQKRDNLDERDDLSGQNDLYKDRTSMRVDALQTGDLSLTLRNPTVSDSGTYTCITRRAGEDLRKTEVQLKVTVPPPVWPKVLSAVLVTLSILAAAIGLFVYKRMKDREALRPEKVEMIQEESVQLPFKPKGDLPRDAKVAWTRSDYNNMKVHVYESGNNQPERQDQDYRGRTEMDKDPLRTGDLSLTLKDLRLTDSGVYTCTVYNKDGHKLLQKSVTLRVRVPQPRKVEVIGARTVHLSFETKADLPQDVTVEWTDSNNRKVHVYESGKDYPHKQDEDYRGRTQMRKDPIKKKDLNLKLKDLHLTDSGVYTCTVYNKDGNKLLQKSVNVSVRALQPILFEVTKGESVHLPFKTTGVLAQNVTVEWRRSEYNMKVHVYKSGNNQPVEQHPDYKGRTEMNKDPLRTKDLSLTLKDLRLTDSGLYTCIVKKDGDTLLQKSVSLGVRAVQTEMVVVTQAKESVLLPFKTTADIPEAVTVEWRRSDSKHAKVFVFQKSQSQADKQDQGYRGRAEMDEDPLNTKDLSLTLKDLHLTDSGVYTCTVYNKDGDVLLQRVVTLNVGGLHQEVVDLTEEKSVQLHFETTADLPQDVTVEWRDSNNMQVHVYESGNNQLVKQHEGYRGRTEMKEDPLNTKDLSLTLKDLHLTDSGVYTCTVYNKDGDVLLRKVVTLSVRDQEMQMVVTQGQKFVQLPFKPKADLPQDITVEWIHNNVTVYKYTDVHPQHRGYKGRTEMDEDPRVNKDLSLTLKEPLDTDSGVYTCTVYNNYRHMLLQKSVILCVRDLQPEVVEVSQEKESIQLPFETIAVLAENVTVEWTLTEPKHMTVHVYESGNNQPDKQHQGYRGRTAMDEDPLRTGDLSLTLKHLLITDSGVYTCTVYNKDGHMLLQKVVTLSVRATLKGTMAEMLPHRLCSRQRRVQRVQSTEYRVQSDQEHRNHEDVPLTAEERV